MTYTYPIEGTEKIIRLNQRYLDSTRAKVDLIGNKIILPTGSNASVGTATLVAGTVTVSTTAVKTTSLIYFTVKTASGTQGFLSVPTITNSTSLS